MTFERFFFGKRFKRYSNKKKVKILKRDMAIFCILLIILSILSLVAAGTAYNKLDKLVIKTYSTKIDLSELSSLEKVYAINTLRGLEEIYLNAQKSITFTHNITKAYIEHGGVESNDEILLGLNINKDIYIQYFSDVDFMKRVLCHETLHSFMVGGDYTEKIIEDIDDLLPCYT